MGGIYCPLCGAPLPIVPAGMLPPPVNARVEEIPEQAVEVHVRRRSKPYFGASGVRGGGRARHRFGYTKESKPTNPWLWAVGLFFGLPIIIVLLFSTGTFAGAAAGALLYWVGGAFLFFFILFLVVRMAVRPPSR